MEGRKACGNLVAHCAGRQYSLYIHTSAFNLLCNTNFKKESQNFTAHKYLDDIDYPTSNSLDEAMNIRFFIDSIILHANIEKILTIACNDNSLENEFPTFSNYIEKSSFY